MPTQKTPKQWFGYATTVARCHEPGRIKRVGPK
jgi:hypothetical protein